MTSLGEKLTVVRKSRENPGCSVKKNTPWTQESGHGHEAGADPKRNINSRKG
jgi:hypothetical protein